MNKEKSTCGSCGKGLSNQKGGVVFACPKCHKEDVIRCFNCRQIGAKYSCSCGFTGPN